MDKVFINGPIGTGLVLSLPVSNVYGGTSFVTVALDKLLWGYQSVIVDGTMKKVECYSGVLRDKEARKLAGVQRINIHAYYGVFAHPGGGEVHGWIVSAQ